MDMTAFVWILTYALHSTILIAFVWAALALFPKVPLRLQESLWRVALFGGLATATITQVADIEPLSGRMVLPASMQTHAAPVAAAPQPDPVVRKTITQHDAGDVRITTVQESKPEPAAATVPVPSPPSKWPWVILGLAGLGAVLSLVRLGAGARRTAAKLRGRREVIEDPILETFFELCDAAGLNPAGKPRVRLTASAHLRSPVALVRREVVVPERAIERLTPAQQHSMVAHELAHLQRRDPQWAVVTAVFEALFVFQPLNHLARRKLQEVAEFQCDDWAAKATGGGTHLAKCLAEVASWLDEARSSALTVAMADRDSPVVRRITRLLHGRRKVGTGPVSPALRVGCGMVMLGGAVWLAPGVAPASASTDPARLASRTTRTSSPSTVTVTELGAESGRRRSAVTIEGHDERVQVHVERTPPPPPIPEPPQSGDRIVIHGFYGDTFGWGSGCGSVDVEVDLDGLQAEIEGAFGFGFPFSSGCERRHERSGRRQDDLGRRGRRPPPRPERVEAEPGMFHL